MNASVGPTDMAKAPTKKGCSYAPGQVSAAAGALFAPFALLLLLSVGRRRRRA